MSFVPYRPSAYFYISSLCVFAGVFFERSFFIGYCLLFGTCLLLVSLYLFFPKIKKQNIHIFLGICVCIAVLSYLRASSISATYDTLRHQKESSSVLYTIENIFEDSVTGHAYEAVSSAGQRIRFTTNLFTLYLPGDRVEISHAKPILDSDPFLSYYRAHSIHRVAFYVQPKVQSKNTSFRYLIKRNAYRVRQYVNTKIEQISRYPESELAEGLVLGSRSITTGYYKDVLRKNGVLHIVALSGFNLMLIVSIITRLYARKTPLFYTYLLLGTTLFSCIVGMPTSLLRALVMLYSMYIMKSFGRFGDPLSALIITMVLVALFSPFIFLYDASFHLSCLALFSVLILAPRVSLFFETYLHNTFVREIVATSFSAWVCTMPYLFFFFGQTPHFRALFINILIIPFIAPVTILILACIFLAIIFPFLSSILFSLLMHTLYPLVKIITLP